MRASAKALVILTALMATAMGGCATDPSSRVSDDVMDAIALCNGGLGVTTSTSVTAGLAKVAKGDVSAEVSVSQELVGLIASSLKVSETEAVAFYGKYVDCIQSKQSIKELLALLKSKAEYVDGNLTTAGYLDLRQRFRDLYPRYFAQLESGQAVAAYTTYRDIQNVLATASRRSAPPGGGDSGELLDYRFNMQLSGRRMTADEFDAWMKSRGIRIKKPGEIDADELDKMRAADGLQPGKERKPDCPPTAAVCTKV